MTDDEKKKRGFFRRLFGRKSAAENGPEAVSAAAEATAVSAGPATIDESAAALVMTGVGAGDQRPRDAEHGRDIEAQAVDREPAAKAEAEGPAAVPEEPETTPSEDAAAAPELPSVVADEPPPRKRKRRRGFFAWLFRRKPAAEESPAAPKVPSVVVDAPPPRKRKRRRGFFAWLFRRKPPAEAEAEAVSEAPAAIPEIEEAAPVEEPVAAPEAPVVEIEEPAPVEEALAPPEAPVVEIEEAAPVEEALAPPEAPIVEIAEAAPVEEAAAAPEAPVVEIEEAAPVEEAVAAPEVPIAEVEEAAPVEEALPPPEAPIAEVEEAAPVEEALAPPEAPIAEVEEAAPVEEAVVAPEVPVAEEVEPRRNWLARLSGGLSKSSTALGRGITDLFVKRRLDEAALQDLEDLLIRADLGLDTALVVVDAVGKGRYDKEVDPAEVRAVLAAEVEKALDPVAQPLQIDATKRPHVILVVGVNGSGKTTTIGKVAAKLGAGGKSVMLAAGDTFRAAAIDQLKVWGERAGAPVVAREAGADAAGVVFDAMQEAKAAGSDVLLIDTAGRLQNKAELMAELEKIVRVIRKNDETAPHSVLLVLDATTGQNAVSQVEAFSEKVGVTGLVMTKLDGTARGGILVAISARHTLPVHFIGVGEAVDDLEAFDAGDFAKAIAGLAE